MTKPTIPNAAVRDAFSGGGTGTLTHDEMETVLSNAAPLILAEELTRLLDDRANYDEAGKLRPSVLMERIYELDAMQPTGGEQS
jgi:hypothetical protein